MMYDAAIRNCKKIRGYLFPLTKNILCYSHFPLLCIKIYKKEEWAVMFKYSENKKKTIWQFLLYKEYTKGFLVINKTRVLISF